MQQLRRGLRNGTRIVLVVAIMAWSLTDLIRFGDIRFSLVKVAHAAADPSWSTGAADFEIWESSSSVWDAGTLVCGATLTDTNSSVVECNSSHLKVSTTYRIQFILNNVGDAAMAIRTATDYVQHYNVGKDTGVSNWASTGGASTGATLGTCGFRDFDVDDGATTCTIAWDSTVHVRITNTGAGNVRIAATTGIEGFIYLITTGTAIPNIDSDSYLYVLDGLDVEDSSKIELTGEEFRSHGELYSSTIDLNSYSTVANEDALRVSWSQDVQADCALRVYVRGGNTSPPTGSWSGPYSGSGTMVSQDLTGVSALRSNRYYQYYVSLTSCNSGSSTPRLYDIKLDFD